MDSLSNFVQVANNCSQYSAIQQQGMTNTTQGSSSCLTCNNFKDYHCQKDLYDPIKQNLSK